MIAPRSTAVLPATQRTNSGSEMMASRRAVPLQHNSALSRRLCKIRGRPIPGATVFLIDHGIEDAHFIFMPEEFPHDMSANRAAPTRHK